MSEPKPTMAKHKVGLLAQFDQQFSAIDLLPKELMPAVVTLPGGDLTSRCQSIALLRTQLLTAEELSLPCPWLPEVIQQQIITSIKASGIARYCKNNPIVTDALLTDLLIKLEGAQLQALAISQQMAIIAENKAIEQLRLELEAIQKKRSSTKKKKFLALNDAQRLDIKVKAELNAWIQLATGAGGQLFELPDIWSQRREIWQELEGVFTDLGLVTGLGWDLSQGIFQSHGWMNLVRLQKIVKQIPQLREVIETLGRMKDTEGDPIIEEIISRMSVTFRHEVEVITPLVPMETKGITRSDSISRMLPQEAAFFGHPVLKKLWHVRRAEHALLSYAVEGTELITEVTEQEQEFKESKAGKKLNRNRGPMIVCLDTSGSMSGTPENVAKALVLQCISVAKKEKRACFVYLFGSKGEVKEMELTPDKAGLEQMILFLSMSFGGGTDVEGPLNMALERSDEKQWLRADILLVSDGEFSVSSGLSRKIKHRKEQRAMSVHGVVIGGSLSPMDKICEPLHQFSSWLYLQNNKH
ncbi:VWA domain-containing protein [Shewanella violacea]|nr:VWA domain-containing protein [Shewanella violacea]